MTDREDETVKLAVIAVVVVVVVVAVSLASGVVCCYRRLGWPLLPLLLLGGRQDVRKRRVVVMHSNSLYDDDATTKQRSQQHPHPQQQQQQQQQVTFLMPPRVKIETSSGRSNRTRLLSTVLEYEIPLDPQWELPRDKSAADHFLHSKVPRSQQRTSVAMGTLNLQDQKMPDQIAGLENGVVRLNNTLTYMCAK